MVEVSGLGPDPGDRTILDMALQQNRILVTIDTDFGCQTGKSMLIRQTLLRSGSDVLG